MISIQKITVQELEDFVSSSVYLALKDKPISKPRAISYVNNPRAKKNDVVLYLGFLEDELVSYRTILPDIFFNENKPTSFGWLSGNWVGEKHRRKGISTLLFKEVLKDWEGKLMYTNYAEASKLVYDKTDEFLLLKELKGTKYYNRFCLADILPTKNKLFEKTKMLWQVLDVILNVFVDFKNLFSSSIKNRFSVKVNENSSTSILAFTDNFTSQNLFRRSEEEFNWIQKYPWVLTDEVSRKASEAYNFSLYSNNFESNFYTVYNVANNLIGRILITIRDGHVKIPYAFFLEENSKEIASFIIDKCNKEKIKTIVVYNQKLETELNEQLSFVTKKEFSQKYFITKKLEKSIKKTSEITIQSGDGDVVFT
ncbi:hypothetical protein H9W90_08580 [Polaribacter pectinis]|uniref:Uncharacterized protein n=1 Tax=Polaribacter pectinis TaxID=2738844 RepID=A0A7G9L6L8_9FLAO|nr:hypothetical protein [Polaribacter pectinis]QNM84267.1 hypothetical protein H9W90_08580 [Polaribacter pectinis]